MNVKTYRSSKMNGTPDTANFTLLRLQREAEREEANLREFLRSIDETDEMVARVSNNLGVYFLFCCLVWLFLLFFSVVVLCNSANKPVFLCFTSPSLAGFYASINFYKRVLWISSDRDDRKSKIPKIPGPKFSLQTIPCQISKP